ncbi:NUDIX domain-containing protein [Actinopolymorpha pittospori]|uniref:8-oxo-dGTP diphosphatase n=1 Tax=Actinopolymorpha pittospori TaxID=648752 RepID=A0A927N0D7_9ACTN|nr:NUDIX domain-containing protein [Actinopolymorpha pittospori]MBE1609487.1 8-oxo-dGTP diphosphatase [Actinopolymorpha pittospori]
MRRPVVVRVCAVILRGTRVLMVRHVEERREFWTLPGGGVEAGETPAQAVLREVAEETRLAGTVGPVLYERAYRSVDDRDVLETCFLVEVSPDARPEKGFDPELAADARVIRQVGWRDLSLLADDRQVSLALPHLNRLSICRDSGLEF